MRGPGIALISMWNCLTFPTVLLLLCIARHCTYFHVELLNISDGTIVAVHCQALHLFPCGTA